MYRFKTVMVISFLAPGCLGWLFSEGRLFSEDRLYLAVDDHTDYFWTADEDTYRAAFLEMLDFYLDRADATSNESPEHQSRFNCDGSFWLWTYEKSKPASEFQRLINRIKDDHISVPINALCVCLGGAPAEAVLRGMYYPGQIERRYNLRFQLAYAIENATLSLGLGSLWAGSGPKYCWNGICACDTQVPGLSDSRGPGEVYWWQGLDGSRILMKWYSKPGPSYSLGGYAEARFPSTAVDELSSKTFGANYPYSVAGAFGQGNDDLKTLNLDMQNTAKNATNAQRKVIVSNEVDFFQDLESTYGAVLPGFTASFGNEWEIYCASLAEVSARVKRAVEKLRGAEAIATLVSLKNPSFLGGREIDRDVAWMDLGLYWEHNFGMVAITGELVDKRIAWQRRLASEIESYVDALLSDGSAALGGMIAKSTGNPEFYAFNPLSWKRTDFADFPYSGATPVHVMDLKDSSETPSQLITVSGKQYLRALVRDVPPVGYKVFEVQPGAGQAFSSAATVNGGVIENDFYRVTVAERGAISSLLDKKRGNREVAKNIGGLDINDLGGGSGSIQVENSGPVSVTLKATGSSPLNHVTRVTLFRDSGRIDLQNEITQNFDSLQLWRFGFNLSSPDVWHEEVGAVIRAKLVSQGGHYATSQARYDWLTLNHFADMSSGSFGVTLSNADCYFMQLGGSTPTFLDTQTPQISVLAGWRFYQNILNQGGDSRFLQRFALQTHDGYSEADAMQFALEHQNPLITAQVTGGNAYPAKSYTFLSLSDPKAFLWALKPAEEGIGKGVIARLWNFSGSPSSFVLSLPSLAVKSAKRTTHLETELEGANVVNGSLAGTLGGHEMRTFLLAIGSSNPGQKSFQRGDGNGDGKLDISDPVWILLYLFVGNVRSECAKTADANDDGTVNVSDAISLLNFIFSDGPPPSVPFFTCGVDATADDLSCDAYSSCP
jgi:alpha-mannosidase